MGSGLRYSGRNLDEIRMQWIAIGFNPESIELNRRRIPIEIQTQQLDCINYVGESGGGATREGGGGGHRESGRKRIDLSAHAIEFMVE